MPRPILPANAARKLAEEARRSDTLSKRPAITSPVGTPGDLPYAYIEWIGGYTIAVNTPYNLSPTAGAANDLGDLESWSTAGSGYHSDPALITADYLNGRIKIFGTGAVTRGDWLAQLAVNFGENWDSGDLYATINWAAGTGMDLQGWQTMNAYGKTQGAANRITFDEMVICTSLVTVSTTSTANCWVTGSLMHKGGGGAVRSLDQVSLTVQKIATYPAANGAFVP